MHVCMPKPVGTLSVRRVRGAKGGVGWDRRPSGEEGGCSMTEQWRAGMSG